MSVLTTDQHWAVKTRRRETHPPFGRWKHWWWLWIALSTSCLDFSSAQDFPIAAEKDHYIFRSDGTYSFAYDTGSGEHQSFRMEARDSSGKVSGRFGYVDPDGMLRITEYEADTEGYRANMLTYRRVSSSPLSPLLVGPLPQQVISGPSARIDDPIQHKTTSGPVGPTPFFPPEGPVLIIGPLPKPLQPPKNEGSFGTPEGAPRVANIPRDSNIRDVAQDVSPEDLQTGSIVGLLQGAFGDGFERPNGVEGDGVDNSVFSVKGNEGSFSPPEESLPPQRPTSVFLETATKTSPQSGLPEEKSTSVFNNGNPSQQPFSPPVDISSISVTTQSPVFNSSFKPLLLQILPPILSTNLPSERENVTLMASTLASDSTPTTLTVTQVLEIVTENNTIVDSSINTTSTRDRSANTIINTMITTTTAPETIDTAKPIQIVTNATTVNVAEFTVFPDQKHHVSPLPAGNTDRFSSAGVPISFIPPPPLSYLPVPNTAFHTSVGVSEQVARPIEVSS